ncbi:hypothetical protein LA20533_02175 [Amylolactobacillus amylophilus DSM 20533 = JCM 1125]|uniref:Rhodanese domain-containing protein n=1 Tax=Amylolactobacillus amylophilus DSM 20533 = JCM 1125 TaxID=1423721 RepID=A0A1L6XB12_9LACO|nr:hypothetical protein LA20533_02175 [Amylolactobacillus amylophilus DSM 20533 = JCM 1125]
MVRDNCWGEIFVVESISSAEFLLLLQQGSVNVLDVREEDEYQQHHIPNAINFPVSEMGARVDELDQNELYYVICRSGSRSFTATEFLAQLHFNVINVLGGMNQIANEVA